jgi:hypothetical protein
MVVQIGIQVRAVELLNAFGVFGRDVAVAHVLADHRAILGFHQPVIVAVPGPAFGLLDQQLFSRRATVWLMNSLPLSE